MPAIATVIASRYRIEAELGRGGAGVVYRVIDERNGRTLALKLHRAQPARSQPTGDWSWRMRREFYEMAQLAHPNIMRVYDWGEDGQAMYYTMDFVAGRDAAALAPMSHAALTELLAALCSALGYLHSRGLLHQDVKPRNIRIPDEPSRTGRPFGDAVLMDFGLLAPINAPVPGGVAGTPGYLAPELLLGARPDVQTELYALGMTAHALLTGSLPQKGSAVLPVASLAPPALIELIRDLVATDPRRRPRDTAEVVERLAVAAPLAPDSRLRLSQPPLVARTLELVRLRRAWGSAAEGKGGVVFLVAPPGIGKSRLLRTFALELRISGARVIETAATAGAKPALAAIQALVSASSDAAQEDHSRHVLQNVSQQLARLSSVAGESAKAPAQHYFPPLREWVHHLAASAPAVLVIDDLQWCDATSLEALEEVWRVATHERLLVLAAVRTGDGAPPASPQIDPTPLQIERLRRGALDVIELGPIDSNDTLRLIQQLFGGADVPAPILQRIHEASGGNPHLIVEIARSLVDGGRATVDRGRWHLPRSVAQLRLPTTLEEALLLRLDQLSDDARRCVDALSVIGIEADGELLERAAGLAQGRIFQALDTLAAQQIVSTSGGTTRFVHGRLQEVLYAALDDARRRSLHATVGRLCRHRHEQLLRSQGSADDNLTMRLRWAALAGHHLAVAGPPNEREAVPFLREVADRNMASGLFGDAIAPLCQLVRIIGGMPQTHGDLAQMRLKLALAAVIYDSQLAFSTLQEVRQQIDPDGSLGAIARRAQSVGPVLGVLSAVAGTVVKRVMREGLDAAWASVSDTNVYAVATGYMAMIQVLLGWLEDARENIASVQVFAAAGGREALIYSHMAQATCALMEGHFPALLSNVADVSQLLDKYEDRLTHDERPRLRANALALGLWARSLCGDAADAPSMAKLEGLAASSEFLTLQALTLRGVWHARRGDITRLLATRSAFLEHCFKLRGAWHEATFYAATTPALAEAGLISRANDDLRAFQATMPRGPYRDFHTRLIAGLIELSRGDVDAALADLHAAHRVAESRAVRSDLWCVGAQLGTARAYLVRGRYDKALIESRAALHRAAAANVRFRVAESNALRLRAEAQLMLGELDAAVEDLQAARRMAEHLDNAGERAHCNLLGAELAHALGDDPEAARLASLAEHALSELGNVPATQRAAGLLRKLTPGKAQHAPPASHGEDTTMLEANAVTVADGAADTLVGDD